MNYELPTIDYVLMASTIIPPDIKISDLAQKRLLEEQVEEGQVIVHVSYLPSSDFAEVGIRIWPTTFLIPQDGGEPSKLLFAENIGLYPNWQFIKPGKCHYFTLLFSTLPKSCRVFDLIEKIPQPNGFVINNINRNHADVYEVRLID